MTKNLKVAAIFVVLIFLVLPTSSHSLDDATRIPGAASVETTTVNEGSEPLTTQQGSAPEYVPSEILVKFKPSVHGKLSKNLDAQFKIRGRQSLGIPTIDNLNRRHEVVSLEPLFKSLHKKLREGESPQTINQEIKTRFPKRAKRAKNEPIPDLAGLYKITVPPGEDILQLVSDYRNDPNVEYAEPNFIVKTQFVPDDPYFSSSGSWGQPYEDMWGLKKIEAQNAWDTALGSPSTPVIVAVVDTGVDYNHPDLGANMWVNPGEIPDNGVDDDGNGFIDDYYGYNFVSHNGNPLDDYGHGTHVSGTIAAVSNNGIGIAGIALNTTIMAVKGLDSHGSGLSSDLANAIYYATDNGADVQNYSWGGGCCSAVISDAVHYAHAQGSVLIAAAGNQAGDAWLYSPSGLKEVITVSSTDHNDVLSSFSNWGSKIDVGAPGGDSTGTLPNFQYVNILSLRANGTDLYCTSSGVCGPMIVGGVYYRARGTSMAAPHVAGVAALILSMNPAFTNEEVRQVLRISSDDLGVTGVDPSYGYGRINAYRALQQTSIGTAWIGSPQRMSFVQGLVDIVGTASANNFISYTLAYGEGEFPTFFTSLPVETAPINNNVLYRWDTQSVPTGLYTLKLSVLDTLGNAYEDRVLLRVNNLPDVVMTAVTPNAGSVNAGASLSVYNTAKNQGLAPTTASFTVAFHLSVNAIYGDGDDVALSTTRTVTSLAEGATSSATTSLTIPATTPGGNYNVCAMADSGLAVSESDEGNNSLCTLSPVQVTGATSTDLVMTAVTPTTSSVNAGTTLSVSNTAKNQGGLATSTSFTVAYHLSVNAIYGDSDDVVITTTRTVNSLAAGASSTATTSVTIPSTTPPGSYAVCAMADSTNSNAESDETNNTLCSTSTIQVLGSDLIMTAVTPTTSTVNAGTTLSVSNTAKNQGATTAGSSVVAFHLSSNATYGDGDDVVLTATRTITSLTAGNTSTATTTVTIPSTTPAGSYYVCAKADANGTVTENDETNNTLCSASPITVPLPDLLVTVLSTTATTVNAGATLAVANTIKNQGGTPAGSSVVAFHLSPNATYGDSDDVVATTTRTITSLAIGATSATTTAVTVPSTTPAGIYYVCAKADHTNTVPEGDETNNTLCTATTVTVPLPDLLVTILSTTATTASAGGTVSLSNTIKNQGGTPVGSSVVAFRLSANATYGDGDDLALTATRTIASLAVGATSATTTTVTLPSTTPTGSYYLCALADSGLTVTESDETNNSLCTLTTVTVPLPDLTVSALSTTATTVTPGAAVSVSNTVTNPGGTPAGSSVVAFRLSSNTTYGDGDDLLLTATRTITSLAAGATSTATTTVTLPITTPAGTYYVCAAADATSTVTEGDETNNTRCTTTTLTTTLDFPDLTVSALSTPATTITPGGSVSVTNAVTNSGATAAGSSVVAFHLSSNPTYGDGDDLVSATTRTIASLAVGATDTATTSVVVPSTTPPGTYYLCAQTDDTSTVPESTETNNTRCTVTTVSLVGPDLVVSALSTPATTVTPGASVALANTVTNAGGTAAGSSVVAFRLSPNTTYGDGDDLVLTATRTIASLAVGATSTATTTVVIPTTTPPGAYYLCATADANNTVVEGEETNNSRCTTTTVSIPGPDLLVTAVSTTATTVNAGATVSLANSVKNQGGTNAGSSVVAFRLSPNTTYGDGDDVVLTATRTITSLAVGATNTATTTVTVPTTTPAGTYYLCAKADANSTVAEGDETNNSLCTATTVTVPLPDLLVTALSTTATTVNAGATLPVANTIKNQGGTAAGSSVVAFHLSPNTTYGDGDDVVATTTRTITSLGINATNGITTTVTVPTTTPAGTYYLCAMADATSTVAEGDETNNSLCTATTVSVPLPDLLVTVLSTTATTVNAGATVSLSNTVKNQGGTAAGSSVVAFRLSPNATYGDGDDVTLTTTRTITSVAIGATSAATTTVTVPSTTPPGTYYLCAKADANATVTEGDETNNPLCTATPVTVLGPDLRVSAVSTTATTVARGATLSLSNSVKNQGVTTAGSSVVAFRLSPNTTYGDGDDLVLTATRTIASVTAGATSTAATTVTIPTTAPSGPYYLCAAADANSTVAENDETNNTLCTAGTITVP